MVKLVNRAKMNTSTTGTGTITLGSAKDGFQSFADAGVTDGDVVRYVIEDGDSWEIGLGTYTNSGTTLTRQVLESSAGGSAINLSGDASVFVAASGADLLSQPKSTANDGQLDLSSSSYFKAALTADTFFDPVNPLTGETAQTALLEVSGSTITRNSDVNNAEPEQVQLDVQTLLSGVLSNPVRTVRFSPDGTRLFVAEGGSGAFTIHQVDLSAPFDISSASYSGISFTDANPPWEFSFGRPSSVVFSNDGLGMFVSNLFVDEVLQYSLSTAFDLSSVTYNTGVKGFSDFSVATGIRFSSDGTQLFMADPTFIRSYSLGTAFDLSTVNTTQTASYNLSPPNSEVTSFEFSDDGTALFVGVAPGSSSAPSVQYSLGTAFDLTTLSLDGGAEVVFDATPLSLDFSEDGSSFFVFFASDPLSGKILQYNCPTSFDIAGATPVLVRFNLFDSPLPSSTARGLEFSADGSKMFLVTRETVEENGSFVGFFATVHQFSLSAAFDPSTASYDNVFNRPLNTEDIIYDITFSNDGSKLFANVGSVQLKQFSLGSPFDVSSVTEDAASYSFDSFVFDGRFFTFNGDGTKWYLSYVDNSTFEDSVAEYSLGTPFRLDSVTFEGTVADGVWQSVAPLQFSHDGTRLFSFSGQGEFTAGSMVEVFLPVPYELSTYVVLENSFQSGAQFQDISSARFSASGDRLLLLGGASDVINDAVISYDAQSTGVLPLVVFPDNFKFPDGTLPSGPATENDTALFSISTSDEGATFLCRKIGDFS